MVTSFRKKSSRNNCVFCKIVRGDILVHRIFEDEHILVFPDAYPRKPIHLLIIPKKHIENVESLSEADRDVAGALFFGAQKAARLTKFLVDGRERTIADMGYRLLSRIGEYGGQGVMHMHIHLLGGERMREEEW